MNEDDKDVYVDFSESTQCVLIGKAVYPVAHLPHYKDVDTELCIGLPLNAVLMPEKRESAINMAVKVIQACQSEAVDYAASAAYVYPTLYDQFKGMFSDFTARIKFLDTDSLSIAIEVPGHEFDDGGHCVWMILPIKKILNREVYNALLSLFSAIR